MVSHHSALNGTHSKHGTGYCCPCLSLHSIIVDLRLHFGFQNELLCLRFYDEYQVDRAAAREREEAESSLRFSTEINLIRVPVRVLDPELPRPWLHPFLNRGAIFQKDSIKLRERITTALERLSDLAR